MGYPNLPNKLSIADWQDVVHQCAKAHGWWAEDPEDDPTVGDKIALMHSELSEALEEFRNGHAPEEIYFKIHIPKNDMESVFGDRASASEGINLSNVDVREIPDKYKKPEGIPIELADVVIRIMDFCGRHGIDLETAIATKYRYNETRPYRHGGKAI